MASRQLRRIQVQQLQENIVIRRTLLHRQAEEFERNLISCVNEVDSEAAQCAGYVGHSLADVQKLQEMLRKVDRFTEIISDMNSSLFEVLESTWGEDSGNQQAEEEEEQAPPPAQSRRDSVVSISSLGARDNDGEPRPQSQPRSTQARVPQPSPEPPSAPSLPSLPPQPTPSLAGPLMAASSLSPASTSAAVRQTSQQTPPPVFAAAMEQASNARTVQAPTHNATVDPPFAPQIGSGLVGAMLRSMDTVACHLPGSSLNMSTMDQLSLAAAAARTVATMPTVSKTGDVYALPHGERVLPLAGSVSRREGVTGSKAPPLAQHPPSSIAQPIGLSGSSRAGVPSVPVTNEKPLGQDKLRPNMSLQVVVTHVENPWSFYIVQCRQMLLKLNKQINEHLWKTWEVVANMGIGSLCLAQFTDEVFYRAQIQHLYSDGNAAVYFVDYGNVFITKLDQIKVLPEHLRELPALAIHCCLSEVVPSSKTGAWTQKAINEFQGLVMGEEMMCWPLPLSRVYPHLPVLVELDQVGSTRGEGGIKRQLIQKQLACSIVNEDLLALLESDKGSRLFGHSPPACLLPVSGSALVGDPQVKPREVCPVASAAFESVSSESERLLTSAKLQSILRRIPKFAPDFNKRKEKAFETQPSENVSCSGDVYRSVRVRGEFEGQQSVGPGGDLEARQSVHSGSDVQGNYREPSACGGPFSREETAVDNSHAANRDENTGKGDVGTTLSQTFQTLFKSLTGSDELTSFRAMAATLNSPTDFYIHRVCPETGRLLDDTMRKLNESFSNTQRHKLWMRNRKLEAKRGVLCCAQFKDEVFYRGLVLKTESVEGGAKQVQVFFIDFGDTAWIPRSQVYLLPAEFHSTDPQAIWCSLAYVKPLSAGEGESSEWQWEEKTVQEFQRLLDGDRVFDILAGGQLPSPKGRADAVQTAPIQVIMVDREEDDLCINHDLIVRNFATSCVVPSSAGMTGEEADEGEHEELDRSFDSDAMWQDMEADANSLRNTYKVDIEDAGVAVSGVKGGGGQPAICRFYNRPSGCFKGDKCLSLHMAPDQLQGVSSNLTQATVFMDDQSDLLPREGDVVTVEVSCVTTPSHFYAILPWGPFSIQEVTNRTPAVKDFMEWETLNSLIASMQKFYKNRRLDSDYSVYATGEAVAAWSEESQMWLRAKVLDTLSEMEKVKVMFVDFGDVVWVEERHLRQLDLQFVPMAPQAVDCGLVGVLPPPDHSSWPKHTNSEFFSLVHGKSLVAHVKERLPSSRLLVELYDTTQLNEDINIRTVLIQRGLAVPDPAAEVTDTRSQDRVKDNDSEEGAQDGDVTYVPG